MVAIIQSETKSRNKVYILCNLWFKSYVGNKRPTAGVGQMYNVIRPARYFEKLNSIFGHIKQVIKNDWIKSYQIHRGTMLNFNPGFPAFWDSSPRFDHDYFRTILSDVTHFHIFFGVHRCITQTSIFFLNPVLRKGFKPVL